MIVNRYYLTHIFSGSRNVAVSFLAIIGFSIDTLQKFFLVRWQHRIGNNFVFSAKGEILRVLSDFSRVMQCTLNKITQFIIGINSSPVNQSDFILIQPSEASFRHLEHLRCAVKVVGCKGQGSWSGTCFIISIIL